MEPIFKNFPAIIPDNEQSYYSSLRGVVESNDLTASILVTRRIAGITIRILPSSCKMINKVIDGINSLHSAFGIRVEFSKSMKTTCSINFNIDF